MLENACATLASNISWIGTFLLQGNFEIAQAMFSCHKSGTPCSFPMIHRYSASVLPHLITCSDGRYVVGTSMKNLIERHYYCGPVMEALVGESVLAASISLQLREIDASMASGDGSFARRCRSSWEITPWMPDPCSAVHRQEETQNVALTVTFIFSREQHHGY